MSGTRRSERGLALLVVLWTIVLVSLLASQLLGRTTADLRLARNLADRAAIELAADGGVRLAIAELTAGRDARFEPGKATRIALGDIIIQIDVGLEGDRIDVNAAPAALLEALLLSLGLEDAEARRDAALIAAHRRQARPQGRESDRPFLLPIDLARVPGLPAETWRRMLPYLTTFTGEARPLETTRLEPVRRALALVYMAETEPPDAGLWIGAAYGAHSQASAPAVPERVVRIIGEATAPTGATFVRIAVVALHPARERRYTVLSWQTDAPGS